MNKWKIIKKELLKDTSVKREYDKLIPRYQLISQMIEVRNKKGITQKELANKIGTKQSAIARIEAGKANPTIFFLEKIAEALNKKLEVKFS